MQDLNANSALSQPDARRPGRPLGALQPVVLVDTPLAAHHFAFLRALAQGLDGMHAAQRYLAVQQDRIDMRSAATMARQLVQQLARAAPVLGCTAERAHTLLEPLCHHARPVASTAHVVSLEQFAEENDLEDDCSQTQLIQLWQRRHGQPQQDAQARELLTQTRLRLLNDLQNHLGQRPAPNDPITQWLSPSLVQALHKQGAITLQDCVSLIELRGPRWHRRIHGLGRTRAARVQQWLSEYVQPLQPQSSSSVRSISRASWPGYPVPTDLDGRHGLFRGQGINTYSADTDLQAIAAWLEPMGRKSMHTQRAYCRDIERLYLWCIQERGKALSSLNASDCLAFHDFLLAPAQHWIERGAVKARSAPGWRPLRGPLSARSAQRTMAAVTKLFCDLVESGYLRANPMPRISSARPRDVQLDVARSFSQVELDYMRDVLARLPNDPTAHRLRATLLLYQGTGLRRAEVSQATWADVVQVPVDGARRQASALRTVGKGNKERFVPVRADVLAALSVHRQDRERLFTPNMTSDGPAAMPLIGVLELPTIAGDGHRTRAGALADGGYAILKAFFRRVADLADQENPPGVDRDRMRGASNHWLRHTFAHQVLKATRRDLAVVQQLLGHASISTTGIYVKADMTDRVVAVEAMSSWM